MTFNSRPTKNPVGIPSPIWPKYAGDDCSSGKNVQIMKERFGQQKLSDDSVSSSSDGHQNIVTWLQGINLRRDTIEIMITSLSLLHHFTASVSPTFIIPHDHDVSVVRPVTRNVTRSRGLSVTRSVIVTTSTSCPGPCHVTRVTLIVS